MAVYVTSVLGRVDSGWSQADSKSLTVSLLRKAGSFLFRERPCLNVLRQRSIEEGFRYHVLDSACMCMGECTMYILCIPYVKHTYIFLFHKRRRGSRRLIGIAALGVSHCRLSIPNWKIWSLIVLGDGEGVIIIYCSLKLGDLWSFPASVF